MGFEPVTCYALNMHYTSLTRSIEDGVLYTLFTLNDF